MSVFTPSSWAGLGSGGHVTPPYYSDFLRDNLYPNLYLRQLGTMVTIPRGYGDKVKIPRWDTPINTPTGVAGITPSLSAVTEWGPTEGGFTSAFGLCAQDITGSVKQFTGARGYTDKLILVTKANYIEGALESLSRELVYKFDRHTRGGISASAWLKGISSLGTTSGGTQVVSAPKCHSWDRVRGKNLAAIRPLMDSYNVPPWEDEHFVAVGHPTVQFDIFKDISANGFVPVARYNDAQKIYRGEVGAMYGIRFLLSNAIPLYTAGGVFSAAPASANNGISGTVNGSNLWVFGPDAFYSIELEDGGIEVIHHPPGSSGIKDAANQRGTVAVKAFYGVVASPAGDKRLMRFAHAISMAP